jgi:hypothetical protein
MIQLLLNLLLDLHHGLLGHVSRYLFDIRTCIERLVQMLDALVKLAHYLVRLSPYVFGIETGRIGAQTSRLASEHAVTFQPRSSQAEDYGCSVRKRSSLTVAFWQLKSERLGTVAARRPSSDSSSQSTAEESCRRFSRRGPPTIRSISSSLVPVLPSVGLGLIWTSTSVEDQIRLLRFHRRLVLLGFLMGIYH